MISKEGKYNFNGLEYINPQIIIESVNYNFKDKLCDVSCSLRNLDEGVQYPLIFNFRYDGDWTDEDIELWVNSCLDEYKQNSNMRISRPPEEIESEIKTENLSVFRKIVNYIKSF